MGIGFVNLYFAVRDIADTLPLSIRDLWDIVKNRCRDTVSVMILEGGALQIDTSRSIAEDTVKEIAREVENELKNLLAEEGTYNYSSVVNTLWRIASKYSWRRRIQIIDASDGKTGWLFLIRVL